MPNDFNVPITLFVTWTTYGSWLPGDSRGWMKWKKGKQQPQPVLEDWCKGRMKEKAVLLDAQQREAVDDVIREHSQHRGWELHAVSARSNHVHVAVTVVPKTGNQEYRIADGVKRVRDQFKANATRVLRQGDNPIQNEKVWTKGGDIQFIDTDAGDRAREPLFLERQGTSRRFGDGGLNRCATNRRLAPCRSQTQLGRRRQGDVRRHEPPNLCRSVRRDHQAASRLGRHEDHERRRQKKSATTTKTEPSASS